MNHNENDPTCINVPYLPLTVGFRFPVIVRASSNGRLVGEIDVLICVFNPDEVIGARFWLSLGRYVQMSEKGACNYDLARCSMASPSNLR